MLQRLVRWQSPEALALTRRSAATMLSRHSRLPQVDKRRKFHLGQALMPPLIFSGLFVVLWCWKCAMLVIFQNTIIYNPFIPPNARRMQISEYSKLCGGLDWREERIRSLDKTQIALCMTEVASEYGCRPLTPVYILYFQGNASSLPPRLPDISRIIHKLKEADLPAYYTIACVSYRGYWTSHDRPYERGIDMDTEAAMRWISRRHRNQNSAAGHSRAVTILWGQSIGCGFATNLAANTDSISNLPIDALVLETPFTNTRAMLQALYPQKWLPYQYLWPFLRNHLNSLGNLERIATKSRHQEHCPAVYIVEAGKDELVPSHHGTQLFQRCQDVGLAVERHRIRTALHNDVSVRQEGKQVLASAIVSVVAKKLPKT